MPPNSVIGIRPCGESVENGPVRNRISYRLSHTSPHELAFGPSYGLSSGVEDFIRIDAHAVHRAMIEGEERKERMPCSANALVTHAGELRAVREKTLDRLPDEVRRTYPDWERRIHVNEAQEEDLGQRILIIAAKIGPRLTVAEVAASLDLAFEDAKAAIERLVDQKRLVRHEGLTPDDRSVTFARPDK